MLLPSTRRSFVVVSVFVVCAVVCFARFGGVTRAKTALAMLAASISATNVDSLAADVDGDGRADPGDTVQYTVTVNNGGPDDATGVKFTDALDTNETIVGGSLTASPVAVDDTYSTPAGPLNISAPGALTNDYLG